LAQVVYSAAALEGFERIIESLLDASPSAVGDAVSQIRDAIRMLERHPAVGRRYRARTQVPVSPAQIERSNDWA